MLLADDQSQYDNLNHDNLNEIDRTKAYTFRKLNFSILNSRFSFEKKFKQVINLYLRSSSLVGVVKRSSLSPLIKRTPYVISRDDACKSCRKGTSFEIEKGKGRKFEKVGKFQPASPVFLSRSCLSPLLLFCLFRDPSIIASLSRYDLNSSRFHAFLFFPLSLFRFLLSRLENLSAISPRLSAGLLNSSLFLNVAGERSRCNVTFRCRKKALNTVESLGVFINY